MSHRPRFILQPYKGKSTRHTCPQCGKQREFARYVDTATGELLPDHVGKCNRADRCGYHYTPKQHFADGGNRPDDGTTWTRKPEPPPTTPHLHARAEVAALRTHGENNTLSAYFRDLIGSDRWDKVAKDYALGTWPSGRMAGAAVYWQVDIHGHVKGGKVMQYDPTTGHRDKQGGTTWVHSLNGGIPDGKQLEQCLFGEHLLKGWPMDKPVAVVESEKTAMIAAALMPSMCWTATGSKTEFKLAKLQALTGRKVLAFPDLSDGNSSTFYYWKEKAVELQALFASIHVSDLLEAGATFEDMENGLDIGDYLLREGGPAEVPQVPQGPQEKKLSNEPPTPPKSRAEVAVERMAAKNPSINLLVDLLALDLSTAKITNLNR